MSVHEMKLNHVGKAFRRKTVLDDINCHLHSGVYGLLGPNGAGKTTLMRCITNYYSYQGEVMIDDKLAKKFSSSGIGYLPQKFEGFPELTVKQMMDYFCNLKKIMKREREDKIQKCLLATNLSEKENEKIRTLSGGMIRRLGIAQAILGEASVLLLDEPTAGLDPEERMRFKDVIERIAEDRIVIISTHIVEDIEACCDHVIVMNAGRIVFADSIDKLRNYAGNRILELRKEELSGIQDAYVEKSYFRNGEKIYRVIVGEKEGGMVESTIEDGYVCLLHNEIV